MCTVQHCSIFQAIVYCFICMALFNDAFVYWVVFAQESRNYKRAEIHRVVWRLKPAYVTQDLCQESWLLTCFSAYRSVVFSPFSHLCWRRDVKSQSFSWLDHWRHTYNNGHFSIIKVWVHVAAAHLLLWTLSMATLLRAIKVGSSEFSVSCLATWMTLLASRPNFEACSTTLAGLEVWMPSSQPFVASFMASKDQCTNAPESVAMSHKARTLKWVGLWTLGSWYRFL